MRPCVLSAVIFFFTVIFVLFTVLELRPPDGQGLDYRRPDILVHNPYGGGRKVIIEVAVTATNGQTRTSHYDTNRPLKARYDQKIQKYTNAAQALGYRLIPCVMSWASTEETCYSQRFTPLTCN